MPRQEQKCLPLEALRREPLDHFPLVLNTFLSLAAHRKQPFDGEAMLAGPRVISGRGVAVLLPECPAIPGVPLLLRPDRPRTALPPRDNLTF